MLALRDRVVPPTINLDNLDPAVKLDVARENRLRRAIDGHPRVGTAEQAGEDRYDFVFVESSHHSYSQIKRVQPNLVILCVRIAEADGFQVLSMLKLDPDTREIPVLTYTTEYDGHDSEEEVPDVTEPELFSAEPAVWMN